MFPHVAGDGPYVSITGHASYLPKQIQHNAELIARFQLQVDPEWIERKTGIRSRHWLKEGETTSDMVVAVARRIFEQTGTRPDELDQLIVATISPDYLSPSTATIVAGRLGLRCMAFDVSAACAGFIYAFSIGASSIRSGARKVMVIAADARSRFADPSDRRAIVLFADGAAGVLLEPSDRPGVLGRHLGAEGRERMGAHVPAGGAKRPTSAATLAERAHYVQIDRSREIFDLFVQYTRETCTRALMQAEIGLEDIDLFITHQGNARMVQAVLDDLHIPKEKAINNITDHGNSAGSTVPIALSEALASGRIRPGDN